MCVKDIEVREGKRKSDKIFIYKKLMNKIFLSLECGSTQLVVAQVFHAGGEREGRRLDRRRQRVLPETSG